MVFAADKDERAALHLFIKFQAALEKLFSGVQVSREEGECAGLPVTSLCFDRLDSLELL